MSRPDGLTDTQWEEVLDAKYRDSARQNRLDRIQQEGFEVGAYEVEGATCERAVTVKFKNRWGSRPCGKTALVTLKFAGPQNPAGTPVALCRGCVGWLAKDLIGYLDV